MNFNRFLRILAIVSLLTVLWQTQTYAKDKWNILIGNWVNPSGVTNTPVDIILKKSFNTKIALEPDYNPIWMTNEIWYSDNPEVLRRIGIQYKADVIVFGVYYIEGENLIVITLAYDVLQNQYKMRRMFRAKVDVSMFDSIDSMMEEGIKSFREILPEMSMESEVEIKKIRKTLYDEENVDLKRIIITRFGLLSEFGHKRLIYRYHENSQDYYEETETAAPFGMMSFGFMFRLYDFRMDVTIGDLPNFPKFDIDLGELSYSSAPTVFEFLVSYYPSFLNNQWAIGLGINSHNFIKKVYINENNIHYDTQGSGALSMLSLFVAYQPIENLEINYFVNMPFPNYRENYSQYSTLLETNFQNLIYYIPYMRLSATYFFNDTFGIEGKFYYANYSYYEGRVYPEHYTNQIAHNETLGVYLGMSYKVDFFHEKKKKVEEIQ